MTDKPSSITGGCLCEGIRYTMTFPDNHDFTKSVRAVFCTLYLALFFSSVSNIVQTSTCQCQDCRKQTGSLIFRVHQVPKANVVYSNKATLKIYHASPDCERGFCGACGSFLFWCETKADSTSVCVGTFDKEHLKKYGTLLTYAERHLWCIDEIQGVTSHLKGEKWEYDTGGTLL